MAFLPSYQEATAKLDWLKLIAPYCSFNDYRALCLVNSRFRDVFSPLLWTNLFSAARLSGVHPGDDLAWWLEFVFDKLDRVTESSRALVRILDGRHFAKQSCDFSSDQHERTLTKSFQHALYLLPNISAILLDGHTELDLRFLLGSHIHQGCDHLRVLSVANHPFPLPKFFFAAPCLQSLVYLDISNLPGSILPLVQSAPLPSLQVLKVREREIDNSILLKLVNHFMRQLWSLDVSKNKVTDDAVQSLRNWCLPSSQLRSDVHSDVEGKLVSAFGGTDQYGPFLSIEDSDLSASFSHNERYFVDAPVYVAKSDSVAQEDHIFRQDGGALTRRDDAEEAIAFLAMDDDLVQAYDHQRAIGTTYLRLSHNLISAVGLQKLLHIADGHVEDLACDSMPFLPKAGKYHKIWPPGVVLTGILGAAHCFRPVMSPNLRVLRIHHSVITNIPTFHADGLSYTARLFLAETTIRERADAAFPQTFIPDMNPRLLSLTLTCLPRRSSGPLISRLIQFIKLLSIQERNIQDVSLAASTRRGPNLLKGLRHLRLEFEPDCVDDGLSTSVNLDAEELMNSGDKIFSFFEGERVEQPVSATASRSFVNELLNSKGVGSDSQFSSIGQSSGSDRDTLEFVTHHGHWNGKDFSVKVWIGPGSLDVPEVLKDYRQMVLKHHVVDGVGPATPAQIRAGAPQKSFVYHIAWSAAVMPPTLKSPTRGDLAGMSDVLDALKAYRSKGRSNYMQQYKLAQTDGRTVLLGNPHYFWRGRLEVSTEGEGPVA